MRQRVKVNLSRMALLLTAILLAYLLTDIGANAQTPQEIPLQSKFVRGPIPVEDPNSDLWREAAPLLIPMAWQNITKPMLLGPSIRSLAVRSLNNGTWVAFMMEWNDDTKNSTVFRTEQFRDAAAIMFPLLNETNPPFLGMGEKGKPVNIWHWKADWQEDIDNQFQDLEKAHPNAWVNYYPFSRSNQSYPLSPTMNQSKAFLSGWAAGNPLSNPIKVSPVEDLIAEGFGTLTSQRHHDVIGKGAWADGVWRIILARPLTTSDPSDVQLQPGGVKHVAFAVWEGGNREVDGRKSFSNWHIVQVEAGVQVPVEGLLTVPTFVWRWVVVIGMIGFSLWLLKSARRSRS